MTTAAHKTRTLWLAGALHAFTHLYQVALLPLYLLIQRDLGLATVDQATLLVTVMGVAYFLPSYPMGWLADRFSRKKLLAIGLILNGLGFVALSLAPSYPLALAAVVVAGLGGSFFHPAATALIARMFPVGTGRALGLFGIGAGIGFLIGPIYAGWRAGAAGWRAPVLELGLAGVVAALLFWWFADEERAPTDGRESRPAEPMFPTRALWLFFLSAAVAFSLRDFAGFGLGSLNSLFLQQAHGFDPKSTGLLLSAIFVGATLGNPVFGHLSDGGRLRWIAFVLTTAALLMAFFPQLPRGWIAPVLCAYGFFLMGSYPMVEASLMESVPDAVRGRVFGAFITIGGMTGNLAHWFAGHQVRQLGENASHVNAYGGIYLTFAACVALALLGLPCLRALRRREEQLAPAATSGTGVPPVRKETHRRDACATSPEAPR
jgi:FSR family fosmidomycin resistance protein-like MFS transporter